MTAEDRTVQVPVPLDTSVLRRVASNEALWDSDASLIEAAADEIDRLRALLSQPTPTAEPMWFDRFGPNGGQWVGSPTAEPLRIEDMAPGTTFTEEVRWTVTGTLSTGSIVAHSGSGGMRFADRFDPSTIRDVTPPAVTS